MWNNCLFYAVWQWIRRGGWLLLRRSARVPVVHFAQADDLPEDLPVRQFVPDDGVPFNVLFKGHVEETLGPVKPPEVVGSIDWVLFWFMVLYVSGIVAAVWIFVRRIFWA